MRPAKTRISLGILQVWSESSLCTQWVAKDPTFLHADSEDSDQAGRMPRLIWVFAGCTDHFVGFVELRLMCQTRFSVTHLSSSFSPFLLLFLHFMKSLGDPLAHTALQGGDHLGSWHIFLLLSSLTCRVCYLSCACQQEQYEPCHKKTCLRGLRPGKTQTGLHCHKS